MSRAFPLVPLGNILTESPKVVSLQPDELYKQVTVRLWGKGVALRALVRGADMAGDSQRRVRSGQFILSRIDARNGALGLVPAELEGAIVSNDFPAFVIDRRRLEPRYVAWLSRTEEFVALCRHTSEGTTNRVRLKVGRFLANAIPLPPLAEQRRIVARITEETRERWKVIRASSNDLLINAYDGIVRHVPRLPFGQIAPLYRRQVEVDPSATYLEIGIRSFGRGTFHKQLVSGLELGSKRMFRIEPQDILFNNVFAWEGAVAVATSGDTGRVGSHRFLSCVPKPDIATPQFLCFYFLTRDGLDRLGKASPGGAGRNRTLGQEALAQIPVPFPPMDRQRWFDGLAETVGHIERLQNAAEADKIALLPSVLDRAFKGGL